MPSACRTEMRVGGSPEERTGVFAACVSGLPVALSASAGSSRPVAPAEPGSGWVTCGPIRLFATVPEGLRWRILAGYGCVLGRGLEIWYISDVDDNLVAVGRDYRDRQPHRLAIPVVGNPVNLEHRDPAVRGYLEELRFDGVRRPHGNPVTVTHLLDAERLAQVRDGSFNGLGAHQSGGAALGELHRVEGRLKRVRLAADMALLVAADYFGIRGHL